MYQNSPRKIVENFGLKWSKYKKQVLGGEAAMWSEQVRKQKSLEKQFMYSETLKVIKLLNSWNKSEI